MIYEKLKIRLIKSRLATNCFNLCVSFQGKMIEKKGREEGMLNSMQGQIGLLFDWEQGYFNVKCRHKL